MPDTTANPEQGEAPRLSSLLWPPDYPREARKSAGLRPEAASDLDLRPLLHALTGQDANRERFVTAVLSELCTDPAVIAYRADVVTNFLEEPELCRRLERLLPQLTTLVRERQRPLFGYQWNIGQIAQRLGELELYVDVVLGLAEALDAPSLHAPALRNLHRSVNALIESEEFQDLRSELPSLRARLEGAQSVTIGVNLSHDLHPESATILSIDAEKIEGRRGLLRRLLGREAALRGITKLRGGTGTSLRAFFPPMQVDVYGHENPLVEDLRRLLEHVMTPVGEAIERYVWAHTRDLAALEAELSLLLNGVALIDRLREAGLPMCRPEIAPAQERISCLEGSYNVSLALRTMQQVSPRESRIVTNPVTFDGEHGRVWILTGPNRGGKTTYVRAVGLAHLLFQAGLYVPARTARMSPIDALYSHFPTMETTTPGEGRLDDEAIRLAEIFRSATPRSLILLNEVLSGTSTLEALGLARDAVRGLRLLGARAVYVTHLHELARHVDDINETTDGDGTVGSLVAEVDEEHGDGRAAHRRTFRIRPSPPLGLSYASEIAEQHGISYRQLVCLLEERGLVRIAQSSRQ